MEKLTRYDKIYLDKKKEKESSVNTYLTCRDGIVECYEYRDLSGYGSRVRLFYCQDAKHDTSSIIRQTYSDIKGEWIEEGMFFDSDSFLFLKAIVEGRDNELGGRYSLVRDY